MSAREPQPGCSRIAHERLGFCGHCPEARFSHEAAAWRVSALGGPVPDLDTFVRVDHDGERFTRKAHA